MNPLLFFLSHAKSLQLCPTLCDPMDCSPPGSSVHGVLQARILEWIIMPSSREGSQPRDRTHIFMSPALAARFFTISTTWEATHCPPSPFNLVWLNLHQFCLSVQKRWDCIGIKFSLRIAFVVSHRFWIFVFSHSFLFDFLSDPLIVQ